MLKDKLVEFKNLTIDCINLCNKEDYDGLDEFINKRQKMIDFISELSYTSTDFKSICLELNLVELEKKLSLIMEEKKAKLKCDINNISRSKKAHNVYNRNFVKSAHFLKKRI